MDAAQVFYISRDGVCEREAIIDDSFSDMGNWAKGIWEPVGQRIFCISLVGLNEGQIRDCLKWQQKKAKDM